MKNILKLLLISLLLMPTMVKAQVDKKTLSEWEGRKYSMFIHWGIYAELGGVWQGRNVTYGLSEQIQAHAGIYSDRYAAVAKRFNPEKWDADAIVLLAKNAGMKSIVFTSKHHDGFCMFHSQYTNFNIVDATPYKRDVLKELSEACKKHGIEFGLYFSLIDWHYPEAAPISSHNSDFITPEHFQYNKKQIEELLSNYGSVSELWFDMGSHSFEQSKEMYDWVHKLQPNCMIGSRLGNDMNDFNVMGDNQEPDYIIGVPWQSPASFFDETWGYRSWQERGSEHKKTQEKLASLIRVASRGGNYLLNIGPRGDGSVVDFEKNVLLTIGKWLNKNGEAIYNTSADPFHVSFPWGSVTTKANKIYLHVMSMPKNRTINLDGLKGNLTHVEVLADKTVCNYHENKSGFSIIIPESVDPTKEYQVITLTFTDGFAVPPINAIGLAKNLSLNQHNSFKYFSNSAIDYNSRFQSTIKEEWTLTSTKNQKVKPVLYYTDAEKGKSIKLGLGDKTTTLTFENGQELALKNTPDKIIWGSMYLLGPMWTGIGGLHDDVNTIDVTKPWSKNASTWQKTNWEMGKDYKLTAEMNTGYYVLQEIQSPTNQQILIDVTSGDGVQILLNGELLSIHNNPYKDEKMNDVILLDLKAGKNQLLVKLYNNFQKQTTFGMKLHNNQKVYKLVQPDIQIKANENFLVNWQLAKPVTPHQTLNLPNLVLKFE